MREPNFVIGGCVASGTSFLSHSMKDHPDVFLPRIMRPECGFFYKSWEYNKGKDYYISKWFAEVAEEAAVGERSSLYLHGTFNNVAKRIAEMYPDIKLIFCLRNPTERAYGNYRFTAMTGFETLSFRDALTQEEARKKAATGWMAEIRPFSYRERGCYYDQLEPYFELFPKENIHCVKSDVLAENTGEALRAIFRFLGVRDDVQAAKQADFISPNVRSVKAQYLLRKLLGGRLDVITEDCRKNLRASSLSRIVGLNLTAKKQPLEKDTMSYLNDFYVPHNEKLAKLLGWNLSNWR